LDRSLLGEKSRIRQVLHGKNTYCNRSRKGLWVKTRRWRPSSLTLAARENDRAGRRPGCEIDPVAK